MNLGLKSCSVSDLDGGWTEWGEWTAEGGNCKTRERNCTRPRRCGRGITCRGQSIEKIGCEGNQ